MEFVSIVVAAGFLLAAMSVYRRRWAYPASIVGGVRVAVAILLFAAMVPLVLGIASAVSNISKSALVAECRRSHDPLSAACLATGAKPVARTIDRL
jgi:ABC-type histidine transport system ATPase subunit